MKMTRTKRLWIILLILVMWALGIYFNSIDAEKKSSHKHDATKTVTKSQTTTTADNGTITKQTITNDDTEEEEEVELSYYNTIEDAVKSSDFAMDEEEKEEGASYTNKKVIKEKVLFLESETDALLFFIGNLLEGKDDDALVVYKFKVKQEGNQIKYSTPTNATQIAARSEKRDYEHEGSKQEIQTSLNLNNAYQSFNLYPETTQLQWGMSYDKNAPNLTINGEHPTKVIPIELDGDDCYFWYYEDLKYDSSKKAKISFKKIDA
ncbi:hypothetical protein HCA11_03395 [Listeria seeligeri]|nr:hypothetical protein [Listeria seeligeri]MBC1786970.1 hypothetical protein [Listeria seeligeri]MBC2233909.1 hypothetical protein [Listeria seeligeri]